MKDIPDKIGRYEITEILGQGSVGIVYKAYDPFIKRPVALKILKKDFIFDEDTEEFSKRFYKEAQIAGTLNHPNIAIIYDAGECGDISFICMEYINGIPLNQWLEQTKQSFIIGNFLSIILQVSQALDYAHAQGVIHRDIKPANILITQELQAKILDFGIALFANIRTTKEGKVIGTPYYMAPEQILGKKIDHRVDIFSLAVIVYEAITGKIPFTADTITGIITRIAYDEPDIPSNLNELGFIPDSWEKVFTKALAKEPAKRYPTASLFAKDLELIFPKMQYASLEVSHDVPSFLEKTAIMQEDEIEEKIIGEEDINLEETFIEEDAKSTLITTPLFTEEEKEEVPEPDLPPEDEIIELEETDTVIVEEPVESIEPPKPRKKKSWLIIPIAVIVLIGTLAVVLFFLRSTAKLPLSKLLKETQKTTKTKQNLAEQENQFTITVLSVPEGAEVYQNDTQMGTTPFVLDSNLESPTNILILKTEGYDDYTIELIPLAVSYSITFAMPLKTVKEVQYAALKIFSEPSESKVFLRGKLAGSTPLTINNLSPGKYTIVIEKEGYKSWEGTATVRISAKNTLNAALEKIVVKPPPVEKKPEKPKVPDKIENPVPLKKIYPKKPSRAAGKGDVTLKLTVSEKGQVENVEIVYAPDPILAEASIRAAKQWKFKPGTINGKAAKGEYTVVFRFQ
ncbi:MAG: hypothetical protein A2Y62_07490 [Candidatus Fischerbacteria bacterium RBG_13_37_8]|uniref:Uncharacterized protein n=1 Tax=Candidatus Fischerbacteria bacterium RBG_13_37_8 TaxID=1817863 RepID=A0A1F5VIS4_9BACT|nr:MAG: hypothetical protein A2Y62_07490 [Candidatus Fischerbacteria bacterium RBG_13_37_8]